MRRFCERNGPNVWFSYAWYEKMQSQYIQQLVWKERLRAHATREHSAYLALYRAIKGLK
jgi:hypothetical protein